MVQCAGQAVVQMAVRRDTMEQYAMKFFLSSTAFKEESALYMQEGDMKGGQFAQFLPKVLFLSFNFCGESIFESLKYVGTRLKEQE